MGGKAFGVEVRRFPENAPLLARESSASCRIWGISFERAQDRQLIPLNPQFGLRGPSSYECASGNLGCALQRSFTDEPWKPRAAKWSDRQPRFNARRVGAYR